MKKSISLVAAMAVFCVAGSASALDTNRPLGEIRVLGSGAKLSSAGGQIASSAAPSGGYCNYQFEWLNPRNAEELQLCTLQELRPFGKTCSFASLHDIDTAIDSVAGQCDGYNAAGAVVSTKLHLTEFSAGGVRMQGVAIQGTAAYPVKFS